MTIKFRAQGGREKWSRCEGYGRNSTVTVSFFLFPFFFFFFFFERESTRVSRAEGQRERERESQAASRLSSEPDAGFDPKTPGIT